MRFQVSERFTAVELSKWAMSFTFIFQGKTVSFIIFVIAPNRLSVEFSYLHDSISGHGRQRTLIRRTSAKSHIDLYFQGQCLIFRCFN